MKYYVSQSQAEFEKDSIKYTPCVSAGGSSMYAQVYTRLDIIYAVSVCLVNFIVILKIVIGKRQKR